MKDSIRASRIEQLQRAWFGGRFPPSHIPSPETPIYRGNRPKRKLLIEKAIYLTTKPSAEKLFYIGIRSVAKKKIVILSVSGSDATIPSAGFLIPSGALTSRL